MPTQFLGTVQQRSPFEDILGGMQTGLMLRQQLGTEQEKREQKLKTIIDTGIAAYMNTDEAGRNMMKSDPGWTKFVQLGKRFYPTRFVGNDIIMPREEKKAEWEKVTVNGNAYLYNKYTGEYKPIREVKPKRDIEIKEEYESWITIDKGTGQEISRIPKKEAPAGIELSETPYSTRVFNKATGKLLKEIPHKKEIEFKEEEVKIEKEKVLIKWGELDVKQIGAETQKRKTEIEARYKERMASVAEKTLAEKARATDLQHSVDILSYNLRGAELESLDNFRQATIAEGADRIAYLREALKSKNEQFKITHRFNIGKHGFFRQITKRQEERKDQRLALDEWVAHSDKALNEARLEVDRLNEMHDYIIGQANVAVGEERNRLTEQANTIKQFIANYEKEIAYLEQNRKEAETANKIWESKEITPARVGLMEAQAEAAVAPGKQKNIFMDLMSKAITDVKKTYPSAFLESISPDKRLEYSKEIMRRAYPLFVNYLKTEPNLTSDDKSYYSNLARMFMVEEKAEVEVPPEKQKGKLTPFDVNKMIKDFIGGLFGGDSKIESVANEAMRIWGEQGIDAAEKYAQSQGFSLDQIGDYLKKTRKK